ncbi:hypothetical protein [Coleofasciculus sp. F4-SAH-05]|uniref:hypothetical protein n=1 Tax=Coleofasciculus sp. F4-SAH-05 TaxID=3069525 RepID=UPI0032FBD470
MELFINAGGSPLPGSPIPFQLIPSCDHLFPSSQLNHAIAGCSHFHQLYWAQRFEPRATRTN